MELIAKLKFDEWMELSSIILESEIVDIKLENGEYYTYVTNREQIEKFLMKTGIDWPKDKTLGARFIALDWLEQGYISTLHPKQEAESLWQMWKSKYGSRLEKYAPIWSTLPEKERNGYVYILKSGPYYKIGRTKNILSRFPQIHLHLPFETRLVCIFYSEDMFKTEKALHQWYSKCRVNGEWFILPESEVYELKQSQPCTHGIFEMLVDEFGEA